MGANRVMSITIELTPEREARLVELFGSLATAQAWLESIVAVTVDHSVARSPDANRVEPVQRSLK